MDPARAAVLLGAVVVALVVGLAAVAPALGALGFDGGGWSFLGSAPTKKSKKDDDKGDKGDGGDNSQGNCNL